MMRDKKTLLEAVRTLNDPNASDEEREEANEALRERAITVHTGIRKEQRLHSVEYR